MNEKGSRSGLMVVLRDRNDAAKCRIEEKELNIETDYNISVSICQLFAGFTLQGVVFIMIS